MNSAIKKLNDSGVDFHVHSNEVDYGVEFKGSRVRDGYAKFFQKIGIAMVDKPELGPYSNVFGKSKFYNYNHPEFDTVKKLTRSKVLPSAYENIGGSSSEDFEDSVKFDGDGKKKSDKNAARKKEIDNSLSDIDAEEYK